MKTTPASDPAKALAEFWKHRYQKRNFLLSSITSLLHKYGSSMDIDHLRRTFLLSLMGHYGTGESCFYVARREHKQLSPVLAYGRLRLSALPAIDFEDRLMRRLSDNSSSRLVALQDPDLVTHEQSALRAFRVVAPLYLDGRISGIVFLGDKVHGQPFSDFDLEVLEALCAATATTLNNAELYRNARLARKEVQRLFDLRSEVISRITHEFRTPLTVIRGGIEPLVNDSNYTQMYEWLNPAIDRLEELIDDLLRLSVERREGSEPGFSHYDPMPTIESAVTVGGDHSGASARRVGVSLRRTPRARDIEISIGRKDLDSVVRALVENAVRFSRPGAGVSVVVDLVADETDLERFGTRLPDWAAYTRALIDEYMNEPSVTEDGPAADSRGGVWLGIAVSDHGIGIPADEIMTIAEPFRQASNNPAQGIHGKGIGLAIVHRIVSQNGGRVFCRSAENEGTVFTVLLPAN